MEINITFLDGPIIKIDPQVGPQGSQGIQGDPGTTVYSDLSNKPSINGVELVGNKSFEDLGEETITNAELQEIIEQQYSMIFGGT